VQQHPFLDQRLDDFFHEERVAFRLGEDELAQRLESGYLLRPADAFLQQSGEEFFRLLVPQGV
jgi:hypothetical protein